MLVCHGCGGATFPAPLVNGVPTLSAETLTVLQTSEGSYGIAMCDGCCDAIANVRQGIVVDGVDLTTTDVHV